MSAWSDRCGINRFATCVAAAALMGGLVAPICVLGEWSGVVALENGSREGAGQSGLSLELTGDLTLGSDAPEGLSGIAWLGEGGACDPNSFAFAEDSGGRVHFADIAVDSASGAVTGCVFKSVCRLPGSDDLEGIAFDPVKRELWLSDETGPALFKTQLGADGESLDGFAATPVPEVFRKCRKNRSLEALAIDCRNGKIWTASESPVEGDPELLVRLASIDTGSGNSETWFFPLERHVGTPLALLPEPYTGLCGLAVLAGGSLLSLERSFGYEIFDDGTGALLQSLCRLTISLVETTGVEKGGTVKKTVLWRGRTGNANFEGLCLGPATCDGARAVVAVSDGDTIRRGGLFFPWRKAIATFTLSGAP